MIHRSPRAAPHLRAPALLALLVTLPLGALFLGALLFSPSVHAEEAEEEAAPRFDVSWDFKQETARKAVAGSATGEALRRMKQPKFNDGRVQMLEPWWKSTTTLAFPQPTDQLVRRVEGQFTLVMSKGTEGLGLAWLDTAAHGADGQAPTIEKWEAPSIKGSLGIGFDAKNPVNREPFRGSGNAYDRPQHEVSLHWDGMEIFKRTTPMEFRDEKPHDVRFRLAFVVGGCEVSLWMDDQPLLERYFVAQALPYVGRLAFGARNGDTAGESSLSNIRTTGHGQITPAPAPLTVMAIDRKLNDKKHPKNEAIAEFPLDTDKYGRIIATLRLDKPETRFDPWDRFGAVYAFADDGTRYEILRYITPYHRGHVWRVDVTHWRSLLRGKRRIVQHCGTQGEGWLVTVKFDFHVGPTEHYAYRVVNLWSGKPEIGNPDKPVTEFYETREVTVDEHCSRAEVRTMVTGHGMSPNTGNAAEFMPIDRTLTVNGRSETNKLWKTDCYLNPCRPQGGTWKYDRAGWAPGSVVDPWVVDVSPEAASGKLTIDYALAPYVNENRGKTWRPFHHTEAQVVLYQTKPLGALVQEPKATPPSTARSGPLTSGSITWRVTATGDPAAVELVKGLAADTTTWSWRGDLLRADNQGGMNEGTLLVDRKKKEAIFLDAATRKGVRTRGIADLDQTEEAVRALMKHHFKTDLGATKETRTILGYKARRHVVLKSAFIRGKASVWIARKLKLPRMRLDVRWPGRRWTAPLPLSLPVHGTILKMTVEDQGAKVVYEATHIDTGEQAVERFQIPEGYDVPALPEKDAEK